MNRLKHILGVNVPRHVPSVKRSHSTGVKHSAQLRQGSARLVSKGSKTICKQRSKTKSMSLKKSSLESVARGARYYSTQQNVKFTSKRRMLQTTINDANRNSSFIASVGRQPRSYAQMIADYSEAIRETSIAAVRNDDACFGNILRKSPFGTLTSPFLGKRMKNIVKRGGVSSSKSRANDSPLSDPFDRSIRHDNTENITEATNQTYVQVTESKDRSYVKLVADCSKSTHNISVASNGALTPRLLARSSLEPFAAPARNASSTNSSQGIPRKASRVAVETSRQSSTQVSTSIGASKQPQVELHMVPSAKESVVSINVDSASARLSSPLKLASEELSVVVRSNQKASARSNEAQWNAPAIRQSANSALRHRGDFGPMRISISEDSAPIKQIEFSINGKPVSELRSIVARTERLDVLTSPDKIEIRVPFAKDDAASRSRAEDELRRRSDSSMQQILNVQISANFQNESTKGSTDRPHNAPTITSTTSTPSPQAPATRSLLRNPAGVPSAILDNDDNAQLRGTSVRMDIKAGAIKEKIDGRRISNGSRSSKAQRETTRNLSADESDVSTIARANDTEGGKLCARKITNPRYSGANKHDKNESSDTRVPTNMIPWWSSSDGFNRMRKKEDGRKPADWSENKLPNQPSTKPAQSMNNTAAVANNSSDMISHSLQQREEFKPTIYYPSLFRLKPNRENPNSTSEVTRDGFKIKTMQTQVTKKNGEAISSVKRTEPVTLSTFETTNLQNKHVDASGELDTHVKKTSVLPKKFKAPKDTQDSPLKQDREKKSNYTLKETHSIDDTFSTSKVKVRDILDDMKPLEKREDGSLIDYGLKVSSRKSTMKLNSGAKEIRDPSPKVMKILWNSPDSTSKKCMTKTTLKREQINKAAGLQRIGWDKAEKSEAKRIILKEKDDPIAKDLLASVDVKARNENPVKNTKGFQQDSQKSSSSISASKMMETQKSGKLNKLKSSEFNYTRHPFKELTDKQMIQRKNSFAVTDTTKSSSQTKSDPTWKIKDHNPLTDSIEKKCRGTPPFARRAADKLAKTTKNVAAIEIAKQTCASGDLSTKNRQENRPRKSKSALDKRNPAESTDPPKKPNDSAGLKSADPKMRMRTDVKFSELRANFSGSQSSVIGSVSPWAHVDRPEKIVLYSAWLQRFKNDVDDHEKLL